MSQMGHYSIPTNGDSASLSSGMHLELGYDEGARRPLRSEPEKRLCYFFLAHATLDRTSLPGRLVLAD